MHLSRISHFYAELENSPVQSLKLKHPFTQDIHLDIKRDDRLHPFISGNKWRKLKHLLLHIESSGFKKICVMGGAYSNLLHSLSYLGMRYGWDVELKVRGYPQQKLSPTLEDASRWGAQISYVSRNDYRVLREKPPILPEDTFWIAEGGMHHLAILGTAESLMELNHEYDYIVTATATGTCLAGLAYGADKIGSNAQIIGISVLNNAQQVKADVERLLKIAQHHFQSGDHKTQITLRQPEIISNYEFGGYAKTSVELDEFINEIEKEYQIPLEPVYSGKAFYAVWDLMNKNYFPKGSRILLIHCGGLQGKRGFTKLGTENQH